MIISYVFSTKKNLGELSIGERFLEILSSYKLLITKCNEYEPINKEYSKDLFQKIWSMDLCHFLFKGNGSHNFRGAIMSDRTLRSDATHYNGFYLDITYPRKIDAENIIQMGDEMFGWCEAVHGFITANNSLGNNLGQGLPELMWINYYGEPYISLPDFRMPENAVRVHKGFRFQLTEAPKDEKLSDPAFMDSIKKEMGYEYFKSQPSNTPLDNFGILPTDSKLIRMAKISNGEVYNVKIPAFDKSEIIKPE